MRATRCSSERPWLVVRAASSWRNFDLRGGERRASRWRRERGARSDAGMLADVRAAVAHFVREMAAREDMREHCTEDHYSKIVIGTSTSFSVVQRRTRPGLAGQLLHEVPVWITTFAG